MPSLLDTYVTVRPDTANFDGELRKKLRGVDAERSGKEMGGRFGGGFSGAASKAIVGVGGAFAALGVGKFFAGAISSASNLAETQSKVGVLFGQNAKDIQAFAKSAASSLGQTEQQAMDAAATFATFGKSAGLQGGDLTKFSTGFTSLASDLASFNNTSPEQAIEAIGSALRGEAEPLRAYGVLMDDASLRQEALALGLIKTTKEALTPQQKVLAAQALIYKQTGAAQGDFARTSDGLANKTRIMKAQFEGIKTTLGTALLPVALKTATAFGGFLEGLKAQGPRLREFGGFIKDNVLPILGKFAGFIKDNVIPIVAGIAAVIAGSGIAALIAGIGGAVASVGAAVTAAGGVGAALLAVIGGPVTLAIAAFAALTAGVVYAYKTFPAFRESVQSAMAGVQAAISFAWNDVIKPTFSALSGFVTGTLIPVVSFLWRNVVEPAFKGISFAIQVFWETARAIFGAVKLYFDAVLIPAFTFLWRNVVEPAFAGISFAIKTFWAVASVIFAAAKLYVETVLAPVFTFLWRNVVEPAFRGISGAISFAWNTVIRPIFDLLAGVLTNTVAPAFKRGVDAIGAAWDRVKEMAAAPVRFVVNTVIQKGIIDNFNKIADAVGAGGAKIPSVAFAAGGFYEDHRAQIAPAGAMRVWAEPETGGEAYIPLAPAKRDRSRSIWEETGRRLGMIERFAHGGFSDSGFGGVKPNVAKAGYYFKQKYGIGSVGGVGQRSGPSDHPLGLALDFMTRGENGTALANEAIREMGHFGVKYAIWRQQINSGSGWRRMADRGNPTANHYDHVHLSFTGASGGTASGSGIFGGLLDFLGGLDPVDWIKDKVGGLLKGMPAAGRFGQMAGAVPGKIISVIARKLRDLPGNVLDKAGDLVSRLNPFSSGGGSVQDIVRGVTASKGRGWDQGSQWSDLYSLIQKESSWNPRAQNPTSTAFGLFQFLNCVPLDSEILTRRGWLTYDQIRDGDETLGFNPETERNEWTPILGVVVKPTAPVIKLSRSGWSARTTPGHRWWSERRTLVTEDVGLVCPECGATSTKRGPFRSSRAVSTHRARAHGVVGAPHTEVVRVCEFVQSAQITKAHRLRVAAVADTEGNDAITPDEAAIIAWVLGDGHIHRKNGTLTVSIYQSKAEQVGELELLLAEVPHTQYVRERSPGHLPAHTFYLHAAYARDLLTRSGLDELGAEAFVLSLNPKQRAAFLEAMYRAEGSPTPSGDGELRQISQNAGPVQDAIVLAAYLEGYRPTRRNLKRYDAKHGAGQMIGLARPWVGGTALQTAELEDQPVWCVNTGLGTWTMRQDGQVMLTGNSTWAGTGYAKTSDPAIQTHAGLKYIAGRYGSPSGAWAFHRRNNYYDDGGVARGAGMMPKLTSAPERVLSPRQTEAFERLVAALDRGATSAGRTAPLIGELHTHDAVGLELVLQQAQFRERAGHFG